VQLRAAQGSAEQPAVHLSAAKLSQFAPLQLDLGNLLFLIDCEIQVKANLSASQIGFRGEADLLLCLKIDLKGDWTEIYYGEFQPVKLASRHSARDKKSMIAISALTTIKQAGYRLPDWLPVTTPDPTADDEPI